MAVHVGEIHTEFSGSGTQPTEAPGSARQGGPSHPGAREDEWRGVRARVEHLRRRTCAEDFDD